MPARRDGLDERGGANGGRRTSPKGGNRGTRSGAGKALERLDYGDLKLRATAKQC